jgi:segregation and condensation protein B
MMVEQPLRLVVEALLFASERPLSAHEIHKYVADSSPSEIQAALEELCREYEEMGRSFALKEVGGGFQLRTRSAFAEHVLRMFKSAPARLSRAAMETLAIIAYKQPILRQEIERLRGVDVGGILKTLMEKDLIRIMGRKSLPGRPLIYGTTKRFLEVFDLQDINSLPRLKEIRELAAEDATPAPVWESGRGSPIPQEDHVGKPEESSPPEETPEEEKPEHSD